MKKLIFCTTSIIFSCSALATTIDNKSSAQDQLGYSYGYFMGRGNSDTLKEINLDAFILGLKQGANGQKPNLTEQEMSKALAQYKKQNESKQLEAFKQFAAENLKLGSAFQQENAKKAGVISLPSGLQYQVIRQGSGKTPKATSKVKVHYEGRLIDGTVFDSSIARNQPVEFQVSRVIPGWIEGLQLMKEGAKYNFVVPANLAYGEIGSGDAIPPNSTLIFDIELIQVLP